MSTNKVRVAIAGVGNCASSLVQGIEYYKNAEPGDDVPGLMHVVLGGYHVRDVEFVAAFDVDATKVLNYLDPFVEPAKHETFHFTRAWMRGQFMRMNDVKNPDFNIAFKLNLPPSYALIHRVWLGCVGVLCQLDANVPMRGELERWVPTFTEPR